MKLKPPYNSESMTALYDEADDRYWNDSESFGKKFEEVKRLVGNKS